MLLSATQEPSAFDWIKWIYGDPLRNLPLTALHFWPWTLGLIAGAWMAYKIVQFVREENKLDAALKKERSEKANEAVLAEAKNRLSKATVLTKFFATKATGGRGLRRVSRKFLDNEEQRSDYWGYSIETFSTSLNCGWHCEVSTQEPGDWKATKWRAVIITDRGEWVVIGSHYIHLYAHGEDRDVGAARYLESSSCGDTISVAVLEALIEAIRAYVTQYHPSSLSTFERLVAE